MPQLVDPRDAEPHIIGVGLGGSCPECRAPLELGQEYCLECGANTRRRKVQRTRATTSRPNAVVVGNTRRGFPWIWFSLLLLLAVAGLIAFLVYESQGSASAKHHDTTTTSSTPSDLSSSPDADGGAGSSYPSVPTTPQASTPNASANPDTPVTPGATAPATSALPTTPQSSTPNPVTGTGTTPSTPQNTTPPATSNTAPATTPTSSVGSGASSTTGTPAVGTAPAHVNSATGSGTPPTTTTTAPAGGGSTGGATSWPAHTTGYTVVLASYSKSAYSEADADSRAVEAQQHGLTAGVLDSDQFSSLAPNYWTVFSGVYKTQKEAEAHVPACDAAGYNGSYIRHVAA